MEPKHGSFIAIASLVLVMFCLLAPQRSMAQPPQGKDFGFGLILFEPTGGTIKYWMNSVNAIDADIGGESYFGDIRMDVDYLWHFYPFHTRVANLYAGPGIALGFGSPYYSYFYEVGPGGRYYISNGGVGVGIRGIFGIDFVPERTPIELFFQLGLLIGLSPGFVTLDPALGIRFYP